MKRKLDVEIGEGLFSSEPIRVEIEFADHTATFLMTALTQKDIAAFEAEGVKFDTATVANALELSRKMCASIVHGWEGLKAQGKEVEFNATNRDRLAEVPEVASMLMETAISLASSRQQVEEGNSESSSDGTSDQVTS